MWQPWFALVPHEDVCDAVGTFQHTHCEMNKAIHLLLGNLKALMLKSLDLYARRYLHDRSDSTGRPGGISFDWLIRIAEIPKRYINGITRYAVLRWALGEDDDAGLQLRVATGHQGTVSCSMCSPTTRTYSCRLSAHPLCEQCIALNDLHLFRLYSFRDCPYF